MATTIKRRRPWLLLVAVTVLIAIAWYGWQRFRSPVAWSEDERTLIASLWIENLSPLPPDSTNAVADDPRAQALGHRLFFDTRLSANGMISCSTCHQPIRHFTDGLAKGVALGMSKRNTPSIVGSAYSAWLYWDGRKDSQWSQALSPLEDPNEHGSSRLQILSVFASDAGYQRAYESLFGRPPDLNRQQDVDRAFANVGKAIAAYERLLMPGHSRFDDYVAHLEAGGDYLQQNILGDNEIKGLRLFIGEARCTECHNGPLFSNNEFHNTGLLSIPGESPDRGRIDGVRVLLSDPFNCLGDFSDDSTHECSELRFARKGAELIGATRTPSLRNLASTGPFQSKGQFQSLADVLQHYNQAPLAMIGHNEAKELKLSGWELRNLEAFLHTLAAPVSADPLWLRPPSIE